MEAVYHNEKVGLKMKKLEEILEIQFPEAGVDFSEKEYGIDTVKGWDSLGHFNLLLLLEHEYKIQFTADEMSDMKNTTHIRQSLLNHGIEC